MSRNCCLLGIAKQHAFVIFKMKLYCMTAWGWRSWLGWFCRK